MATKTSSKTARATEAPPAIEAPAPRPDSPEVGPKRVLIADDEASIRALLRDFLEGEGFQVSEAETGQQVMKAIAEGGYDLILMDIRMPEMDGLAVLKEMHTKKMDVPIIAHDGAQLGQYRHPGDAAWAPTITSPSLSSWTMCC